LTINDEYSDAWNFAQERDSVDETESVHSTDNYRYAAACDAGFAACCKS
jgi:hypothetical protein